MQKFKMAKDAPTPSRVPKKVAKEMSAVEASSSESDSEGSSSASDVDVPMVSSVTDLQSNIEALVSIISSFLTSDKSNKGLDAKSIHKLSQELQQQLLHTNCNISLKCINTMRSFMEKGIGREEGECESFDVLLEEVMDVTYVCLHREKRPSYMNFI
jgi:hypothetical protein